MRLAILVAIAVSSTAAPAHADDRRPVVGFRMEGDTKVRDRTARYLARVRLGELVGPADLPALEQAFLSSELFEKVSVALEPAGEGYIVVATAEDKHSWVIAPTVFLLPGRRSVGLGFAENDLAGFNQKLLLYGQLGDRESLFFGTYLDPQVRGTKLTWRFDLYTYRRIVDEYANPVDDPTDTSLARTTTTHYLGAAALLGWTHRWWLITDARLRAAWVYFRDAVDAAGAPTTSPGEDGWDVSLQSRITIDARQSRWGVRWGPFAQLMLDQSIPGLDDYGYTVMWLRAYYSWRIFEEHQLEFRGQLNAGRRLPFHEELTLGHAYDLRGYNVDQFRGDVQTLLRAEYSVPIAKWRFLAFRALAFFDSGYIGIHTPRRDDARAYLHPEGTSWFRNDVGAGLRVYVRAVVLPLLGFDVAYGLEGEATAFYFQLGLTDF